MQNEGNTGTNTHRGPGMAVDQEHSPDTTHAFLLYQ